MTATCRAGPGRIGEQPLRRLDAALPIRQPGQGIEVGEPLDALGRRRIAQDVGEAPRQQRPVDGLRNEVGGARLEGAADRDRVLVARHHDDRHRGKACIGAQPSAHGVSVHPRHIDVQQHDGHFLRQGRLERRGSVVETQRGESRSHRRLGKQQPAEILIVGDDGDRLGRSARSCALPQLKPRQLFDQRRMRRSGSCRIDAPRGPGRARHRLSPVGGCTARTPVLPHWRRWTPVCGRARSPCRNHPRPAQTGAGRWSCVETGRNRSTSLE